MTRLFIKIIIVCAAGISFVYLSMLYSIFSAPLYAFLCLSIHHDIFQANSLILSKLYPNHREWYSLLWEHQYLLLQLEFWKFTYWRFLSCRNWRSTNFYYFKTPIPMCYIRCMSSCSFSLFLCLSLSRILANYHDFCFLCWTHKAMTRRLPIFCSHFFLALC
jgi:hypothetical protein